MPKVKKERKVALPRKLLVIKNADKEFHEQWDNDRDPLNFPHPFRIIMAGPPNTGKSSCVKNIIVRADPPFERVVIIHADHENTQGYKDLGDHGVEMTSDIPDPKDWDPHQKTLAIVEDLDLKRLSKIQQKALDRLFGYVSTHKNTSVINCGQDFFSSPVLIRRCATAYVLWKGHDERSMEQVGKKIGMPELVPLMNAICPNKHDSIWVDRSAGSPYPLRKNGYDLLRCAFLFLSHKSCTVIKSG